MDSQTITVIIGVVGAAIAALGLLLAWYRVDRPTSPPTPGRSRSGPWYRWIRTRRGVAVVAVAAVVVLTGVGVIVAVGSPSPTPPGRAEPLTEARYRSELTRACVDADEEAERIAETEPANTVFAANISVERHLVDRLRELAPPTSVRALHDDLIGTWERRLAVLDSINLRLDEPDAGLEEELAIATDLAAEVTELSTALGVRQCGFDL